MYITIFYAHMEKLKFITEPHSEKSQKPNYIFNL